MKKIATLVSGLLLVVAANAAPAPTTYDVEVVIFENRMPELDGGELWNQANTPVPELTQAISPNEAGSNAVALANAVAALERDGHYHVLAYKRWRQNAEERSATKPMRLTTGDGQLDGIFRFYMSRFLHVDLDLAFQQPNGQPGMTPTYRLTERRRIKTQETNYFDHPKFGALVKITPTDKE